MKKITAGIVAAAAVAVLGGTTVFAAGQYYGGAGNGTGLQDGSCQQQESCYTDQDEDGICDYYQQKADDGTAAAGVQSCDGSRCTERLHTREGHAGSHHESHQRGCRGLY